MTGKISFIVVFALCVSSTACRRKTVLNPPVPGPAPYEVLYNEGLSAFHLGTPEGYARAADAFRKASALKPDRCDCALNLAQSLLFLSTEQLLNGEEYEPPQREARVVLERASPACVETYEPFVLRVRALVAGRGPNATDLINRAVDLDPNDAMNWLVLGY